MKDSVDFELENPLEYSLNGKTEEAIFIQIRCPNLRDKKQVAYHRKLKGFLGRAMLKFSRAQEVANREAEKEGLAEKAEPAPEADPILDENGEVIDVKSGMDGTQLAMLLCAYGGDEFGAQVQAFSDVSQHYCFLDGETALGDGPRDRIDPDLFDTLFGVFCANFTMPSLMNSMTGKK